jgi:DNA repair protein RadA/Sms
MGFTRCLVPHSNLKRLPDIKGIDIAGVRTVAEVVENLF